MGCKGMKKSKLIIGVAMAILLGTACVASQEAKSPVSEAVSVESPTEGVTTAEVITETATEESMQLTQKERVWEFVQENRKDAGDWCFLYDLTGDNFPEMLKINCGDDYYDLYVYDVSGDEPYYMGVIYTGENEEFYICRDDKGNRVIFSHWASYYQFGTNCYRCHKVGIGGHILVDEVLGESTAYYQPMKNHEDNVYFNAKMYFDGEYKDTIGEYKIVENERPRQETVLLDYLDKYMADYEILDTLTIPGYDEVDAFVAKMDLKSAGYLYEPEYDYEQWLAQYERETEHKTILIGDKEYDSQIGELRLSWDELGDDFDSDVLNEFPNLRSVEFEGNELKTPESKIILKVSDWCGRIQEMDFNYDQYEIIGDVSAFSELRELRIRGWYEDISQMDYIEKMTNLNIVLVRMDNITMDFAKLMNDIDSIKAVLYINGTGGINWELHEQIKSVFTNKTYFYVK